MSSVSIERIDPPFYFAKPRWKATIPGAERYKDKPFNQLNSFGRVQRFEQESVGNFGDFNVALSLFSYDRHHIMGVPTTKNWIQNGACDHFGGLKEEHAFSLVRNLGVGIQRMVDSGRVERGFWMNNDRKNASTPDVIHVHAVGFTQEWRKVSRDQLRELDPDPTGLFTQNGFCRDIVETVADRIVADSISSGLFETTTFNSGSNGSIFMPMTDRMGTIVENPRVSACFQLADELVREEMTKRGVHEQYQCMSFTLGQSREGNATMTIHSAVEFNGRSMSGGCEANWFKMTRPQPLAPEENMEYLQNSLYLGEQIPGYQPYPEMHLAIETYQRDLFERV